MNESWQKQHTVACIRFQKSTLNNTKQDAPKTLNHRNISEFEVCQGFDIKTKIKTQQPKKHIPESKTKTQKHSFP